MRPFDEIREKYSRSHRIFGESSKAMLTPKGRHEYRFQILLDVLDALTTPTLLDYGCGLGFLLTYLQSKSIDIQYTGMDITPSFIDSCQKKFDTCGRFELIDPYQPIIGRFDIVFCSGVFNLAHTEDKSVSLSYVKARLGQLLDATNKVLICDFLSPFVDYVQPGAQHVELEIVANWLISMGHRKFQIRHDLLPYEYSIVVYKNSTILRPNNVFESTEVQVADAMRGAVPSSQ